MGAMVRQRLTSPLRMVVLFMTMGMPLATVLFAPRGGIGQIGPCRAAALVFAAGMIGQDVSSGTLQLLFARPVTRAEYLISKWSAAALATIGVAIVQIGLAVLIMLSRGAPPSAHDTLIFFASDVIVAIGVTAVMAFFSSLVPGLGDLGVLVLVFFTSIVMQGIGGIKSSPVATRVGTELWAFINPQIDLAAIGHGPVPWFSIVSYVSTVTLCLALAIVVLNRRELSYASSGG